MPDTSRGQMHPAETLAHAAMIAWTWGLWLPVYLRCRRKAALVVIHHDERCRHGSG